MKYYLFDSCKGHSAGEVFIFKTDEKLDVDGYYCNTEIICGIYPKLNNYFQIGYCLQLLSSNCRPIEEWEVVKYKLQGIQK